jgi:hypothetical protein
MKTSTLGVVFMTDKKIMSLSSICAVLLVISIGTVIMLSQKDAELQLKINRLAQIEHEKDMLENEISSLLSQLTSANNEKASLESQRSDLQSQVSNLQSEIVTLENKVTQSYNDGFDEGETKGYQEGVIDGAGTGYNIRDPTYAEAMAFVTSDQTDNNEYIEGEYVCWNFVADFKNNAFDAGYRAGLVYIAYEKIAHAITCFNTVDNGLIFIEPQNDQLVTLTIGKPYWDRTIHEAPNYDDTILDYAIMW